MCQEHIEACAARWRRGVKAADALEAFRVAEARLIELGASPADAANGGRFVLSAMRHAAANLPSAWDANKGAAGVAEFWFNNIRGEV